MPTLFQVTNAASYSQVAPASGGTPPRRPPKCCFCLDVRLGTMALAIWQIALHVVALCVFLVVLFHPHMLQHYTMMMNSPHHHGNDQPMLAALHDNVAQPVNMVPAVAHTDFTPPAKLHFLVFGYKQTWGSLDKDGTVHPKFTLTRLFLSRQPSEGSDPLQHPANPLLVEAHKDAVQPQVEHHQMMEKYDNSQPSHENVQYTKCSMRHRYWVLAFVWLCLGLSCLLLYGAKARRPVHLLPYFCVQLLDYCITTIAIVGSVTRFAHLKMWLTYQHQIPFKSELLHLNRDVLALLLIILFLTVLVVKAYLMGMVWACYRYLLAEQRLQRRLNQTGGQQDVEAVSAALEKPVLVVLPDYEKCLNLSEDFMPPAYCDEKADEAAPVKQEQPTEVAQQPI